MHERMPSLQTANPCEDGQQVCETVFGWTDNPQLSEVSSVLIGTPAALAGLLLLGLGLRWVLHRLVDRLVSRAEEGVRPHPGGRFSRRRAREEAPDRP